MNTFYQILHKTCAESDELYKFQGLTHSLESKVKFAEIVWKYEMSNPDRTDYWSTSIIFIHICGHYSEALTKFQFLDSVRKNLFLKDETKAHIYTVFMKAQRTYYVLNRLCYRYKFNKAPLSVKADLFLNPINGSQHNVMTIIQNRQRYLFTVANLRNIIENSLSNSPYHFSEPLPIKNPYNNMTFNKATLYNIYFFMKKCDCVMSTLFHQYFLCNFNLTKFRDDNAAMIRDVHIKQHLKNADEPHLRFYILDMLSTNDAGCTFTIDKKFPSDKLIKIMRPYLEIYYRQQYTLDIYSQSYLKNLLNLKLREFYDYNPMFGRRIYTKNSENKRVITFNCEHIPFKSTTYKEVYEKTHIELMDNCEFYIGVDDDESNELDSVS
jgi:hypothetical protein